MKPKKSSIAKSDPTLQSVAKKPISSKFRLIFLLGALFLVNYFTFSNAFDNSFVNWDDQVYVEEQPLVLNKDYRLLLKTPVSLNYHPVTLISLAMQVPKDVKKLSPAPFIKLNIWLHIFNTFLVFFLLWMINEKKWIPAIIAAFIFSLHPMHVESVVWISERKDVLYTFFFLLSCISYWQYLITKRKIWIAFTFLLFFLSVLSKAMAVVLPLVLLLLDYWKGRKMYDYKVLLEKIPFFAVSLFFGLMAVSVQAGNDFGGLLTLYGEKTKAIADAEVFTLWQRFQFASYGYVQYIIKFFYPAKICAFYPYPPGNTLVGWLGYFYPLTAIAIIVLALWSTAKTKIFAFGIGFFSFTVLLVLQFLSVGLAIMADRYTYLSYTGLAFIVAYAADQYIVGKPVFIKYGWYALASVFILLLTMKTQKQVMVWKDSESLWTQALQYYPTEDLVLANRGNHRGKSGNITGAMADFELAVSDGCHRADVFEGLGNSYGTLSEQYPDKKEEYVTKAISMYTKAIELEPNNGQVRYNLGVAQLQTNPGASVIAFTEALKLMPYKEANILPILGLSQLNAGKYQNAIETLTKVIESGNKTDAIYYHRGLANLGTGNKDAAKNDFNQALNINPSNAEVKARLAGL